jgi:AraC family transcriptional regulator
MLPVRERSTNPAQKALWFIESHFADDISLDDIARVAGVSRFHMVRAFGDAAGIPVMRYLRLRRLSEAARALAAGAPDILSLALEAGYGSHEAFTRAFREQFGLTPEAVRAQRHLANLDLMEPIKMDETVLETLDPPRFVRSDPLLVAGLAERFTYEGTKAIPALWQRFGAYAGSIPAEIAGAAYGVCYNTDDEGGFDYIAGVAVRDAKALPAEFKTLSIPAQKYAVFAHADHVSTIRRTFATIWSKWLPQSGHEMVNAPVLERYGASFDPRTGTGGFEIWVPIKG